MEDIREPKPLTQDPKAIVGGSVLGIGVAILASVYMAFPSAEQKDVNQQAAVQLVQIANRLQNGGTSPWSLASNSATYKAVQKCIGDPSLVTMHNKDRQIWVVTDSSDSLAQCMRQEAGSVTKLNIGDIVGNAILMSILFTAVGQALFFYGPKLFRRRQRSDKRSQPTPA